MQTRLAFLFLGAACAGAALPAPPPEMIPKHAKEARLILGVVTKGHVYTAVKADREVMTNYNLRLSYAKLPDGNPQTSRPFVRRTDNTTDLRIAHGSLWVAWDTEGELGPIPWYGMMRLSLPHLKKGLLRSEPDPEDERTGFQSSFLHPVENPVRSMRTAILGANYPVVWHYDYLPLAEDAVRLFQLSNVHPGNVKPLPAEKGTDLRETTVELADKPKWSFRTSKYTAAVGSRGDLKVWAPGKWSDEEELEVAFNEPFHVVGLFSAHFFVTASGKVYFTDLAGKGPHKVQAIWDDPGKPVTHVLTDADNNVSYAFGKLPPDKQGRESLFVFPLTTMRPKEFTFTADQLEPVEAKEPLRRVMQLTQVLSPAFRE